MKAITTTRMMGIMDACNRLGVTYNHVYLVLKGKRSSPSMVLKIHRLMPKLFSAPFCTIDYKSIVRKESRNYRWDSARQKFMKIK